MEVLAADAAKPEVSPLSSRLIHRVLPTMVLAVRDRSRGNLTNMGAIGLVAVLFGTTVLANAGDDGKSTTLIGYVLLAFASAASFAAIETTASATRGASATQTPVGTATRRACHRRQCSPHPPTYGSQLVTSPHHRPSLAQALP